jgi:hypothetical protein
LEPNGRASPGKTVPDTSQKNSTPQTQEQMGAFPWENWIYQPLQSKNQRHKHVFKDATLMDNNANSLPPEFEMLSMLIDGQAPPVREAFHYCLCLMMAETGKMKLIGTIPGDSSPLCLFETAVGEQFSIPKPLLSPEDEAELMMALREILEEEDLL